MVSPEDFLQTEWLASRDTNEMGMRLEAAMKLELRPGDMISEAVTNGTIQVTPTGPIVLLKHRQTIGGYPRVFSVISCDVDLLAQHMPGSAVRFRKIGIEEAWQLARRKKANIISLREQYPTF